jgi:pimeloyl-ACP methyl ester carboxylesterase
VKIVPDAMPDIDIQLRDRRLRGRWMGAETSADVDPFSPVLVFLHEGLGCVELWRGFPEALCARVGLRGFAYDRTGYGKSGGWRRPPGTKYMEIEGDQILPEVLDAVGIGTCLLIGHSDGGTVALNYASHQPPMLRGVVTIGAHAVNEELTVSSIRHARDAFVSGDLRPRLERYHGGNVDEAFWLWNNAWLAPGFEPMDAAARLPRVRVPVLALQGEHDEYGTLLQLRRVSRGVSGRCETRLLNDCGHAPHLQDEATTVEVIARFVSTLWRGRAATASRIVSAMVLGCLLAGAGAVQAQTVSCEPAEVRTVLQRATDELQRMDEAAARAVLFTATGLETGCRELAVASVALQGWLEARRLATVAGAPDQLGGINQVLKRLEALRISGTPTSLTVQLASYAEAVLRAGVAAAQDERDEMQVYLALGRDLAVSLGLGAQTRLWPLPIDEVEGELWLEVDRFAEARAAFERAAAAGRGARGTIGLALTAERLQDVSAACAAYLRADTMSVADGPRQTIRAAAARLGCVRR